MQKEIKDLEYTLMGVMHSVDKWLDGMDLKHDEVNRAARMREITLELTENQENQIASLKAENEQLRNILAEYKRHERIPYGTISETIIYDESFEDTHAIN